MPCVITVQSATGGFNQRNTLTLIELGGFSFPSSIMHAHYVSKANINVSAKEYSGLGNS